MSFSKSILLTALTAALYLQQGAVQAVEYVDVLDTPAIMSQLAIKSPLNAVASTGTNLVAVGVRGHILYSADLGNTWQQAQVPVSSDLTGVHFPTPTEGWAVGHDGVVLHSTDSGVTWTKQLDGFQAGKIMLDYYTALAATDPANEEFATLVADAQRVVDDGADKPFLDVWFADNKNGYVVGAFGLIFRTADGGQTWTPQNDKVANPQALHLNAISGSGADITLVSEQGLVLRHTSYSNTFLPIETPFEGTYFGVLPTKDGLIVYGLRGMAFSSTDGGANWTRLELPNDKPLTAAAMDITGQVFLFNQAGEALSNSDGGNKFKAYPQTSVLPVSGAVAVGNQALVLVGLRGVHVLPIE